MGNLTHQWVIGCIAIHGLFLKENKIICHVYYYYNINIVSVYSLNTVEGCMLSPLYTLN